MFGAWLGHSCSTGGTGTRPAALAMVGAMVVLGLIGQAIMGFVGRAVRDVVDVGTNRQLDQASGMVVSTVAFLLAAWMVLTVAASLAMTEDAVRASRSYPLLDQMLAGPGSELIDDARTLLSTLDLPSLPFNTATLPQVDEPSDSVLGSALTDAARSSVVQVAATSSRCGVSQVGSGVVMAPERVVTNVHVITGSGRVTIRLPGERSAGPPSWSRWTLPTTWRSSMFPGSRRPRSMGRRDLARHAGRRGRVAEMIETAGAGIVVNPDDPATAAASLNRLLADDDWRRELGHAARRYAERMFDINAVADRFETVIQIARDRHTF